MVLFIYLFILVTHINPFNPHIKPMSKVTIILYISLMRKLVIMVSKDANEEVVAEV